MAHVAGKNLQYTTGETLTLASGEDSNFAIAGRTRIHSGQAIGLLAGANKAWGGGPFQNGTTALPYMWGVGMDDRVFWWLYTNMFPVDGRKVYASPARAYYAHAAHRLTELIKAIRSKQADCPITVVCHSQGNMVTLGAAMLGMKENAIADTYVMCNPPYNLTAPGVEKVTNAKQHGAWGNSAMSRMRRARKPSNASWQASQNAPARGKPQT